MASVYGQRRKYDPNERKPIQASIHNRFDIEVIDAKTGKVKQKAQAENVILDQLWTVYTSSTWFYYIGYGSGSGTPSASDTNLFTPIDKIQLGNKTIDYNHVSDGYISVTKSATLSETTAVGSTITEVGIRSSSSPYKLCTHAMLTDMNGNPISILKTNTDIINLYATIYFHWNLSGYNNIDLFPSQIESTLMGGSLKGLTTYTKSKNSSSSSGSFSVSSQNVTFNSTTRTYTINATRIPASSGNIGGFQYAMHGPFVAKINGPFAVTNEAVGTGDGTTVDFSTKFDFPENATVYVDGVIEPNVTVNKLPITREIGLYFWKTHSVSTINQLVPDYSSNPTTGSPTSNGIYYNPLYSTVGVSTFRSYYDKVEVSNDLETWITLYSNITAMTVTVPEQYKNYKFWRFTDLTGGGNGYVHQMYSSLTGKNIHFTNPPASGSVITIDYTTESVPKDSNHVFDFSMQVQLAPYITP